MKKIYLNNKNNLPIFAVVDNNDYLAYGHLNWQFLTVGIHKKSTYAVRRSNKKTFYLHRLIMKAQKGQVIDHIDGNGLNNQKSNLRFCTQSQNEWNRVGWTNNKSSKYKGVRWHKKDKKWYAQIGHKGKWIHIGSYDNEKEASKAYIKKAKQLQKEFYKLDIKS